MDELTALDLFGLPQDEAAAKSRARLQALRGNQNWALLGAATNYAPANNVGKMLNENAAADRGDVQKNAETVLRESLGLKQHEAENLMRGQELGIREKEADARIKELQHQIAFQNAQLGLQGLQLQETVRGHKEEERIRDIMTKPTVPGKILENMSDDERKIAQLDSLKQAVPALGWVFDLAKKPIQAAKGATEQTVSGYRAMGAPGVPPAPAAPPQAAAAPALAAPSPAGPPTPPTGPDGKVLVMRDGRPGRVSPQFIRPTDKVIGQ